MLHKEHKCVAGEEELKINRNNILNALVKLKLKWPNLVYGLLIRSRNEEPIPCRDPVSGLDKLL